MRRWVCCIGLFAVGCVVWIREPTAYREELVELVEPREDRIQTCYEDVLAREQARIETEERAAQGPYADIGPAVTEKMKRMAGDVIVDVVVAPKTGDIDVTLDEEATTAPSAVAGCVLGGLDGLTLAPADEREGRVALSFALKPTR